MVVGNKCVIESVDSQQKKTPIIAPPSNAEPKAQCIFHNLVHLTGKSSPATETGPKDGLLPVKSDEKR
ncbi:hypothetical protein ONM39_004673 [Escherichia coli]|nr:hypothetical protein [Escherichia coli]